MKLIIVLFVSSFSYAQNKSLEPKQIKAVVVTQRNTTYPKAPLSLDGYLMTSQNKCLNTVAKQIQELSKNNNQTFASYNSLIGKKLMKMDERCHFFRLELVDYTDADIYGTSTSDMRFTYRCYETANIKLPSQRVSQAPPVIIAPVTLYKNIQKDKDYSPELIQQKCNTLEIVKSLNSNIDQYLKSGNFKEQDQNTGKTKTNPNPMKSPSSQKTGIRN